MGFSTVSVVGLGYIGLPTAGILAARKKKVIGVDNCQRVVDTINSGKIHIVEPELDIVVRAAVTEGYLRATTVPEPADAYLIAVPTPFKEGNQPDLGYIHSAVLGIAPTLSVGSLVILESTSPVGTTEQIAEWLADARPDLSFPQQRGEDADINIAHCPERVLPGHVVRELVENDRLIGGMTARCSARSIELYRSFVQGECVVTDARTAEMAKLTENSFRDVNIAFANELSIICEKLDINVWELIGLANRHPRVNILQPGPGVGGHCIAVDPWFIVDKTPREARLIRTAREVNDSKPQKVIEAIVASANRLKTRGIVCLGAAFKANIDDLRESPALRIVVKLCELGYEVQLVEPNIKDLPEPLRAAGCELITFDQALETGSDKLLAILVAHRQFKASPSLGLLAPLDFCGALNGKPASGEQ